VYRRTIAGFDVLLCKVARPLYSSSQKPAVQNLHGFGFVSAGGFNLSPYTYDTKGEVNWRSLVFRLSLTLNASHLMFLMNNYERKPNTTQLCEVLLG
jgi:hypothetical protein